MGQSQTLPHPQPVTFEQVQKSIQAIFDDPETKFTPMVVALPLQRILQNLSEFIPAQKTEEGFVLNHKMIQIFYHQAFLFSMGKLINLLIDKLEQLGQKNQIMVQKDQWLFCLNLANFIAFFTDDKLIRMIETVSIRSDLSQNTQTFIQKLEKQGHEFAATQSLIDKLSFSEIERIEKCLRISMNQMISMHTNVITRSQRTLKIIQKLEQACFILYLKALYSPQHSQSIINKAKHPQFLKSNLTIGHYFMGKGADMVLPSIYESAVLFLSNLIEKNKGNLREFKCLPSHLFKSLPIVSQNTIYDFVVNVGLHSLSYFKDVNGNMFSRLVFNRIMTLKLLDLVVKEARVTSPQITYLLEEVCMQTRIGMIQRSFITDLVQHYMDIVNESLNANPEPRKQQPSHTQKPPQPKLTRETRASQILTKYLQGGKQNYSIKYSNKKYKITTVDIVTEMENDQTIIQTEFRILCEKYIYEVVLGKKVVYQFNDRQIWNQILPHILQDKGNASGSDEEGQPKMKMVKQVNHPQSDQIQPSNQVSSTKNQASSAQTELKPSSIQVRNSQPEQDPPAKQAQEEEDFEDISDHEDEHQEQPKTQIAN